MSNSEGGGNADEVVERGSSANFELEGEDKDDVEKSGLSSGSGLGVLLPGTEMKAGELEKAIMDLSLKSEAKATRVELISKLERVRNLSADEERAVRKAGWITESQKVVRKSRGLQKIELFKSFPRQIPIWEAFRGNLECEEKASLSIMSELWRNLLERERVLILFRKVLLNIREKGLTLDLKDLLSCRGVCKQWKASMQSSLQNTFRLYPEPQADLLGIFHLMKLNIYGPQKVPSRPIIMPFTSRQRHMARFMDWCRAIYSADYNPLIDRKADYRFSLERGFLFWLGSQIWDFQVCLGHGEGLLGKYGELHQLLELTPNLKRLELNGGLKRMLVEIFGKGSPPEEFHALKERMEEKSLPVLPHLKHLRFMDIAEIVVTDVLDQFGSGLESLVIWDSHSEDDVRNLYADDLSLPSLKQLLVTSRHCTMMESRFTENLPSLEELQLSYSQVKAVDIPKLFRALSRLGGGSLRKLIVSLAKDEGPLTKLDDATMKSLSLELPHLEEFSLGVNRINLKTLDFILPMASLKKLNVSYIKHVKSLGNKNLGRGHATQVGSVEGPSEEIIKWGEYTNRLYESNIWTLFPDLRKVTISAGKRLKKKERGGDEETIYTKRVYTREGFKEYLKEIHVSGRGAAGGIDG